MTCSASMSAKGSPTSCSPSSTRSLLFGRFVSASITPLYYGCLAVACDNYRCLAPAGSIAIVSPRRRNRLIAIFLPPRHLATSTTRTPLTCTTTRRRESLLPQPTDDVRRRASTPRDRPSTCSDNNPTAVNYGLCSYVARSTAVRRAA